MKTLRITGVPEHFNYPFILLEKEQPLQKQGVLIQWIDESRGSGQMNLALRNNETDLAVLLTESFLKDFEAGNPSKMIGYHVQSPLTWGIHVRKNSGVNHLSDLANKHFLVSRMGSGSHLMALVLAKRENWQAKDLTFEIIGNMDGAKEAMDNENDGVFLWEKYTTTPMLKNGTMRRIGEVPSPWPCFVMAASEKALTDFGKLIFEVRDEVYKISKALSENPSRAQSLASNYQLDQDDVEKWLKQTIWCCSSEVSQSRLKNAIQTMKGLGIIQKELPLPLFLANSEINLKD
jgi:ABC-type nitrate/sulfonate/bicarbonate transport system substrate-binding protein